MSKSSRRSGELRFDGDPVQFRLGVEARRIDIAFAYEMAAVAVSNIQPLPHQLEAVYECFLREPRLRFLLADDPGAGKTIMAGLYMKELILRRAGDRILVVTPANLRPQWVRELAERFQLDFVQLGASHFDASLTENPWDQFDQIVVSRDFLRTDRAREAFDAADKDWDLAVVDEAHGFTISVDGKGLHQQEERTVQGGGSGGAPQPPADPDDGHAALGARLQPVGAAAAAGPGRLGGPLPAERSRCPLSSSARSPRRSCGTWPGTSCSRTATRSVLSTRSPADEWDLYNAGHRLRVRRSSARSAASSPRPLPGSR